MFLPGGSQRDDLNALALALVLELLLLGLAAGIYTSGIFHPKLVMKDLVTLQLASLTPETAPPAPPTPRKVEKSLPVARNLPAPLPEPVPTPELLRPSVVQGATPSPFVDKSVQSPSLPVSHPAEADVLADYTAKIRNAVQTALVFPKAADALRYTGRTRVEFHLYQGRQSGARIMVSSGIGMFDRAALQALQDAVYPQPPEALRDQSRLLQIWVEFRR